MILAGCCLSGLGQPIPGKVFDSSSRQPLPFVTIHIMKTDRSPVKTVLSDSTGSFSVAVDSGMYIFLYTCAGYHPFQSSEITIDRQFLTTGHRQLAVLPPVYLSRDTAQLAAVTVLGRRPVIEPSADGFTYNAENDIAIAAGSAVDVLRKIPMVSVTPDGNPTIRGSANIRVFIDNKPSSVYAPSIADALQQVPSEEIARVEIITHPSARYDAEGTDAVINIITKKKRYNGFNGQVRSNIGMWQQDITATLKMRTGYWITNFEGGAYYSQNENGYSLHRSRSASETSNRLLQQREAEFSQNTQSFGVNVIRVLDSLNSINAGYRYRNFHARETALQHSQLYSEDTIATEFTRHIPGGFTNLSHTFTAGYTGQSRDKQKEYNLLAGLFKHSGTDEYNLSQLRNQLVDYRENMDGTTTNTEFSLQADFAQRFKGAAKLETGIKGSWRNSSAENLIDIFNAAQGKFLRDEVRSNLFEYERGIYAAYGSYSRSIKNWQFRAGLRFELTRLFTQFKDTSLQIPNFNNLVPNLLIKKTFNEKNSLTYSYNPRINRPYLYILNPNINYVDSLNINYGNPGLVPEVWHVHTLDYNYNNKKIFAGISLQYTKRARGIEEIRILRPDKIVETTYRNIGRAENWGLTGSIRYNNGKFNLGTTMTVRHISLKSPALNLSNSGFQGTIDINASYRFKNGFALESFVYVESGSIALQAERSYYLFYNLLVSKKFLKDKLNVVARFDGFFDPWFYRDYNINTPTLFQTTKYKSINRNFRLAISYKFGKDIRTPVTKTIDNND